MIAWLRRGPLVILVCGLMAGTGVSSALSQETPEAPATPPAAERATPPAARAATPPAAARTTPAATRRAAAPAPAPAPQRELVYVVIGREPTGDPSALLRALEAVLGQGYAAPAAPSAAAPVALAPGVDAVVTPSEMVTSATPESVDAVTDAVADASDTTETVTDDATETQDASPDETALASADAPAPREWREMGILPWTLLGVGAAAFVGGAITGGLVLESRSELDTMCGGGICTGEAADALGRTNTMADAATALLVGGGIGLAGGLIWLAVADAIGGDDAHDDLPSASLSCDGNGCSAQMGMRF